MITPTPEIAVIDTNIWLDWLVFDDAKVRPLMQAGLTVIASRAMRDELDGVLKREHFALTESQRAQHLAQFDNQSALREAPAFSVTRLRCTDRDDQKFVELAVAARASFLITRDKALLKLAKRAAREHQLLITECWQASGAE